MDRPLNLTSRIRPRGSTPIMGRVARSSAVASEYAKVTGVRARMSNADGSAARSRAAAMKPSTRPESPPSAAVARQCSKLHRRRGIPVGVVGVRGDRQTGEREVRRGDLDPDVEEAAVVGLANEAQARGHGEHRSGLAGDVAEQEEP